jgi:hypothetical protein
MTSTRLLRGCSLLTQGCFPCLSCSHNHLHEILLPPLVPVHPPPPHLSPRCAISSLREQASACTAPTLIQVDFSMCGTDLLVTLPVTPRVSGGCAEHLLATSFTFQPAVTSMVVWLCPMSRRQDV